MENSSPSSYLGGSASHALTTGDHTSGLHTCTHQKLMSMLQLLSFVRFSCVYDLHTCVHVFARVCMHT